jgi:hypothetical protein
MAYLFDSFVFEEVASSLEIAIVDDESLKILVEVDYSWVDSD